MLSLLSLVTGMVADFHILLPFAACA
jgi:hypothetical protein